MVEVAIDMGTLFDCQRFILDVTVDLRRVEHDEMLDFDPTAYRACQSGCLSTNGAMDRACFALNQGSASDIAFYPSIDMKF